MSSPKATRTRHQNKKITSSEIKKYSQYQNWRDYANTVFTTLFILVLVTMLATLFYILLTSQHPTINLFNMVISFVKMLMLALIRVVEFVCYLFMPVGA